MKLNKITRRQFMKTAGVAAAVSALAACGNGESTTTSTSAVGGSTSTDAASDAKQLGMFWWGNQVRNEGTQAALDLYAEQNPGVSFNSQFAEWSDYWTKLATSAASHTMEDIIQMDYGYIKQYVANGLLTDLTPYIEDGTLDVSGISESIMAASTIDGGIYAICNGVNAPSLIYNKTLVDEAGITVKDNMTTDEFIAVSKEIYDATGVKTNVSYGAGYIYLGYLARATNQYLFEEDKLGVASSADLELYYAMQEQGVAEGWHCSPEIFAERTISSVEQDPLVMGDTPDQRSWCWFGYSNQLEAGQAAADAEGIELALTSWPSPDPKRSNYLKPSQFFCVSIDSANPDEAAKVLDFFTNSLECNEILMAERGVPASAATAEALAPMMTDIQRKAVAYINEVVTPCCSPIDPPVPETAAEAIDLMNVLQEKVCYQQMSAVDAASELFEKSNEILGG